MNMDSKFQTIALSGALSIKTGLIVVVQLLKDLERASGVDFNVDYSVQFGRSGAISHEKIARDRLNN